MSNPRSRAFNMTINYHTYDDFLEVEFFIKQCDYWIIGLEGCDDHHPHIHFSFHMANAKTMSAVLKSFSKQHHTEVTHDIKLMHEYCKGIHAGKVKCPKCSFDNGFNPFLTEGVLPQDGKQKSSELVMSAIKQGKTHDELRELFPSFMMFHGPKVKQWLLQSQKPVDKIDYYWYPHDKRDELIQNIARVWSELKLCYLTDLTEIEAYSTPPDQRVVVLDLPSYSLPSSHKMWPHGIPIIYKYGYETRQLTCQVFIIVSNGDFTPLGYKKVFRNNIKYVD